MEVRLDSPFPVEALPRVWGWMDSFRDRVSDDFGPKDLDEFVRLMVERSASPGFKSWAVSTEGELGGLISFEKLSPWLGTAHCLFKPSFQGRRGGLTLRACRSAVGEMFTTGIGKLAFYPLAGNLAVGNLIVMLGGSREGVLKGHTLSGGEPVDVWMYGLTKESFEHASSDSAIHSSDHRSGGISSGLGTVEPAEDGHEHQRADVQPGAAAAHGTADR